MKEEEQSRNWGPVVTRGQFLRLAVATVVAAGAIALPKIPSAEAAEGIEALYKPWSSRYWGPMAPEVAQFWGLHQIYPSLRKHDQAIANKYGGGLGHSEEWARDFDKSILAAQPNDRGWLGYCASLNDATILDSEPPFRDNTLYGVSYGWIDRVHWEAVKHAADRRTQIYITPEGFREMIKDFRSNRIPFGANLPVENQTGWWFRAVFRVSISGETIRVTATNFGAPARSFSLDRAIALYRPDPDRSGLAEPETNPYYQWFNPEFDESLADEMTYA